MLTLHDATDLTKKIFLWILSIGIGCVVLYFLGKGALVLKEKYFPTPGAPPTVAFGKLPKITFPATERTVQYTYVIDTVTGTLPLFNDRANVYKIVEDTPSLLNIDTARNRIRSLGDFSNNGRIHSETPLSETTYQWVDDSALQKTIIMDTLSFNFSLTSSYINNPVILTARAMNDPKRAIDTTKDFLNSFSSFPTDFDEEKTTTELLTIESGVLAPANSLATTKIVRVDFFQNDLNTIPVFYPYPPYSTIHFLVGSDVNNQQVVEGTYFHQKISKETPAPATYPIKTAEEAFEELKNGGGSIRSYKGSGDEIRITNVFLAYYMGEEKQAFVLPIIVFQGDNEFYAYISAIKDTWIE